MNAKLIEKTDEEFADSLTEIYGTVEICGMTFDSGRAFQELDPTAFSCAMADEPEQWQCSECDSIYETEEEAEECCKEEEEEEEEEEENENN